ncbi:putative polyketide synthase [Hypoxylon crocopeplum]|nr:putative polyketide synthase [Hypoxylon crocopeplum]
MERNGYSTSNGGHANGIINGHTNGTKPVSLNGVGSPKDSHDKSNGTSNENIKHATQATQANQVPIAICGMGMRLPGGIRNDTDLYNFLINKRDARSRVPGNRYSVDAYYDPQSKPGTIGTKHGYFIDDVDFSKIDVSMFSMTPAEAERLDPNQRLLLEVVREAFESAGEDWKGKNIGSYVGLFTEDWQDLGSKDITDWAPYQFFGKADFTSANRIAYEYDLKGPSMTIKTACSAAGLGLHLAAQSIRLGETRAAIVAGSNLILAPGMPISLTAQLTLSPDGSSKTFDASANGYARGEGVTALFIKRLDDAIRDGNPIRAILRASCSNADGRTHGMSMPSSEAHETLMRQTYASAGLELRDTAMFECHGTGTAVGDPLEVNAVARCLGSNGTYIGSIKPNLGHSEGASALSSIIKAVVSLENRTIIPNIKFNTPNPSIPWKAAKLAVPVEPMPWPENRAERISVNSFGIGGSNVHFILDSAASFGLATKSIPRSPTLEESPSKHLLLLSANHPEALKQMIKDHQAYLQEHPGNLVDAAYTLSSHRESLKLRSYCVIDCTGEAKFSSGTKALDAGPAAFVFTGQGAQWVNMGKQLILSYPSVQSAIRKMDRILQELDHAPSWTIEDVLLNSDDKALLGRAEYSQPLCTAVQIVLVDLLEAYDIKPSAVVGHSSGEIAGAYAAGVLTMKEAIITAFYRGYICKSPQQRGGMAAIGAGREVVETYLSKGVRIACENSASSVTLSGDVDLLEAVMESIKKDTPGMFVRQLQVEMAYHSHHMESIGELYEQLINPHLHPQNAKVPFYSSAKAKTLSDATEFGPKYWRDNLENPVLFHSALKNLLSQSGCTLHIEVGPHSALAGPLKQIYRETGSQVRYVSALNRGNDDVKSLLDCIGQVWSYGFPVQFPVSSEQRTVLADLPRYPWHYDKSYWTESRVINNWKFRAHPPHELLGVRTLEASDVEPVWRNKLRLVDVPWVREHCVGNDVVVPAVAYLTMAGEAAFQLSGKRDYTVRDVNVSRALVFPEDKSLEIVTSLRPQRLTNSLESQWYEFNISTFDGTTWNKHVWGLVCGGMQSIAPPPSVETFQKPVSSDRWYTTLARAGLILGPRFTGMKNMTASVTEPKASAHVRDEQYDGESYYPLHPVTLDALLQTLTVATVRGEHREFAKLFLPTSIQELYVSNSANREIHINTTFPRLSVTAGGYCVGVLDGETAFFVRNFRGTSVEGLRMEATGESTALHLQWKPHFDFLSPSSLTKPRPDMTPQVALLERLFVLCTIEAKQKLLSADPASPHFKKFRAWIDSRVEDFKKLENPVVEDSARLASLTGGERQQIIQTVLDQIKQTAARPVGTALYRSYDNLVGIVEGRVDFLDLLLQDGLLPELYNWVNSLMDLGQLFQHLGNTQPQMRILEIGAGTGGLTAKILEKLKSDFGERLYLKYTFTDVSSGFFVQAQERFKDYSGMEFKALDITKDPLEQGFHAGEYDLIIASNVLHATPILTETLRNARTLLHPDGRLFLQELSPTVRFWGFIFGLFSNWWLGEDGRIEEPFISPDEWDAKLRQSGFNGCESVTLDNEKPYHINANIIARPAVEFKYPNRVTLLSRSSIHPLSMQVQEILSEQGYRVDHVLWGDEIPSDQDLISFVDLSGERPLLQDLSEKELNEFLEAVESLQQSAVLWLTPPGQVHCQDPHAAQILGMARTVRAELAMSFATLELDKFDTGSGAATAITQVIRKIQRTTDSISDLDPDLEYVFAEGSLQVSRFHWFPLSKALSETTATPTVKELTIGQRGLLNTLGWAAKDLTELAASEVQVRMSVVGMNFKDVVIALGIINTSDAVDDKGHYPIGLEGAGYVTKVGSDIKHVKAGDRVVVIGPSSNGLATEVQRPGDFCVKIPDRLSSEDAATMPLVYVTVLRCLLDKADLQKGQSVLIHSGAGGVGIAAIHIARWIGADIYVTVGTNDKIDFLVKELGVPRERIFNSRNISFLYDVMTATGGRGVDVVLNSVSGELLHASWKCVAQNGCMVEIGQRDLTGKGRLAMDPFADNRSFCAVDISRLSVVNKPCIARLLTQTMELYDKGVVKPIHPISVFDAAQVEDAFRYMQKGVHIGKLAIKFPDSIDDLPLARTVPEPKFRNDVSYLLVGGMGGLGKSIATWMVSYGATNLIFLSRSAGKSEKDQMFVKELNAAGCSVQCFAGDVADESFVHSVRAQASKPVGGVMQMAMVLRDIGVLEMDEETWNAATRPKIQGTWNLHNALLQDDLDFFVLFGSTAGILGYYGQANYASANAFLDAFVQYRQGLQLPASAIDIGANGDVGFVARTQSVLDSMKATSGKFTSEEEFLDCLHLAIARSSISPAPFSPLSGYYNPAQVSQILESSLPIMDPGNNIIWKRDARMAIYRNIEKVNTGGAGQVGDSLKQLMTSFKADPSKLDEPDTFQFLAQEIANTVSTFLMKGDEGVDLSSTLSAAGVDSLVAIEVRNWWKQNFGVEVSVLALMNGGNILQLGELAAKRLKQRFTGQPQS